MATSTRRWPETTYTYDPNGNLTSKTEGSDVWAYTWNAENQLTKVEKNSVEQARFAYDPKGRRVEKVAGGVTTSYTYDGAAVLREARSSTTLKYVHGPAIDEPLAVDDGASLSYFHADVLGSIVRMTNATGAVALTRQYDAWGNLETGGSEPGYAFTGREWDTETELFYYRARYYSPELGRFVSEDPLGSAAGINYYVYVSNAPTVGTDPFGLFGPTGGSPVSPMSCYELAQFLRYRPQYRGTSDKFRHCVIACVLDLACGGSNSMTMSAGKEFVDVFGPGDADIEDFIADLRGMLCAIRIRQGKQGCATCESCCRQWYP